MKTNGRRIANRSGLLAAVVLALSAFAAPAASPPAGTFVNPLVLDGADPFIAYREGSYYFLSTASTCMRMLSGSPSTTSRS